MKLIALSALVLILAACGDAPAADPAEPAAPVVDAPAEVVEVEPTDEPAAELGTRDNPVPLGQSGTVADWDITVTTVNPDAAALVAAENQFNDPPAEGHVFVLVGLSATYNGADSSIYWSDTSMKVLGSGGNTFDAGCGVFPGALDEMAETFGGATIEGNACFSIETAQLPGATLMIDEFMTLDDDGRVFFALE